MSSLAVGRTAVPFFFPSRSDGVAAPRRNAETSMRTQKTRLRTEGARWIAWHHRTRSIEFLFGRNRDPFSSPPTPHPPKRQPNFNSSSIHERHCNCSITSILFFFFFIPWFIRAIMIACWQDWIKLNLFLFFYFLFLIIPNRAKQRKEKNQDLRNFLFSNYSFESALHSHVLHGHECTQHLLLVSSIIDHCLHTSPRMKSNHFKPIYLRPLQFLVDNFCEIIIKLYRRW